MACAVLYTRAPVQNNKAIKETRGCKYIKVFYQNRDLFCVEQNFNIRNNIN